MEMLQGQLKSAGTAVADQAFNNFLPFYRAARQLRQ